MKCLIVDDDPMSRKLLDRHCSKVEELEMVGSCESVKEALAVMEEELVDLIFLDIEMPEANGFELLDRCSLVPYVIITSSREEYAFEAFQYQVSDYLRKPISIPRFNQSVQKVLKEYEANKTTSTLSQNEDIFIKSEGRYIKLNYDEILFIENVGDYVKFNTEKGNHIVYSTMKRLEEKLPGDKFMKVHRSYIINFNKIIDFEDNSILINKKVIPVSRSNRPLLMQRLNLI